MRAHINIIELLARVYNIILLLLGIWSSFSYTQHVRTHNVMHVMTWLLSLHAVSDSDPYDHT